MNNNNTEEVTQSPRSTQSRSLSFFLTNRGAIYSIISSFILSTTGIFIKKTENVPILQLAAFRTGGQVIILWPIVLFFSHKYANFGRSKKLPQPDPFKPEFNWFPFYKLPLTLKIVCRAIFGSTAMTCYYKSITYLPIGDASCFLFSNSIVATLLAAKVMKEKMSKRDVLLLLMSIFGCVFVAQPRVLINYLSSSSNQVSSNQTTSMGIVPLSRENQNLSSQSVSEMSLENGNENEETMKIVLGVMYGVITTLMAGSAFFFIRWIGQELHFTVLSLYYALVGSIVLWPMSYISAGYQLIIPSKSDLLILTVLVFSGFAAQGFRTLALQYDTAYIVSIYGSTQIFFAFAFDWLFFGKSPNVFSSVGACLIVGSVVLAALEKARVAREAKKKDEICMQSTK